MSMKHLIRSLEELRSPTGDAKRFDVYVHESDGSSMGWRLVNTFTYLKDATSFAKKLQESRKRAAIFRQNNTKTLVQDTFYPDGGENLGPQDILKNEMLYRNGGTLIKVFKAK
jgi:hypothetical protein